MGWLSASAALILLSATALAQDASMPTFGATVVIPSGLRAEVYHIPRDSDRLPNFRKLKSRGAIYTSSLNIPVRSFKEGFPGVTKRFEWFALDYTGRFWIEKPGPYLFSLMSDDGSKLYVDDELVIDNDGIHAALELSQSIVLEGGIHRIRVSYFQGPRMEVALILRIAGPGEKLRVFSTDEFRPPTNPETWKFGTGKDP